MIRYFAKRELCDEDWKTQLAQGYSNIPSGAEVDYVRTFSNAYGIYVRVKYNNRAYDVKPEDLVEIDESKIL